MNVHIHSYIHIYHQLTLSFTKTRAVEAPSVSIQRWHDASRSSVPSYLCRMTGVTSQDNRSDFTG